MLWERLKEPSTYAGFAGVALALGMSEQLYGALAAAIAAMAGVVAIVLRERGQ